MTVVMANESEVMEFAMKKVLRAILITAGKMGLTLDELNQQYEEYEGQSIPFGRL